MVGQGIVSGNMTGDRTYSGRQTFAQGASGAGIQVTYGSNIWYVDGGKSTAVTGDGTTWDKAFLTITEAVAKAGNDDIIFIAYAVYAEAAKVAITQHGLRLIGVNPTRTFGGAGLITTNHSDDLMSVNANRVEITGLTFWCNTGGKNGIVFGETYDPWHCYVHNCYFGTSAQDGSGGEYGIKLNETNDCSDTTIENCTFHDFNTAGIVIKATRSRVENCIFQIYNGKIGIDYQQSGSVNPEGICLNNNMVGWGAGSNGCTGIQVAGAVTAGRILIARNVIANCETNVTGTTVDAGFCQNWADESAATYLGVDAS